MGAVFAAAHGPRGRETSLRGRGDCLRNGDKRHRGREHIVRVPSRPRCLLISHYYYSYSFLLGAAFKMAFTDIN